MKFIEAKNKLKEIADGAYHSLTFHLCEHNDGTQKTNCDLYIDGKGYFSGEIWEQAFEELIGKPQEQNIEEMPDI